VVTSVFNALSRAKLSPGGDQRVLVNEQAGGNGQLENLGGERGGQEGLFPEQENRKIGKKGEEWSPAHPENQGGGTPTTDEKRVAPGSSADRTLDVPNTQRL